MKVMIFAVALALSGVGLQLVPGAMGMAQATTTELHKVDPAAASCFRRPIHEWPLCFKPR